MRGSIATVYNIYPHRTAGPFYSTGAQPCLFHIALKRQTAFLRLLLRPVEPQIYPHMKNILAVGALCCNIALTLYILFCPVLSCPILSCLVLFCHDLSCPVLSRLADDVFVIPDQHRWRADQEAAQATKKRDYVSARCFSCISRVTPSCWQGSG